MIELVILASSCSSSPSTSHSSSALIPPPPPNPSSKLKSKPSLRTLPSPSKPVPALHSRFPAPSSSSSSSSYVRWDLTTTSSLLNHYATLAAALAAGCRLHDFAFIAESLVASGVEASRFASALNLQAVAKGIVQSLREGNVMSVVEILRRVEAVGVSTVKLFDGVAMELLKVECSRILDCGEVEKFVDLMDALAGFSFPVKELVDPSEVIRICIDKRNPKTAVRYVSILPRERILYCTILNEFGKRRDLDSALTAYEEWKQLLGVPNMYVYRTIIDVCGLCGDYRKSRLLFQDLINQEVIPNVYVFNSLMNVNAHDLSYTLNLYKNMQKLGVSADVASYNILLKACCLAGRVDLAQDIYREIREMESRGLLKLDVFTYCTIIKVFADAKLWQMALKVKEDMKLSGITPNRYTWSSMISACANAGLVEQAILLFEEMLQAGCEPNPQCCNILLHACVEACQYDRAFRLFKSWKGIEDKESSSLDNNGNADSTSSPELNNRTSVTIVSNCTSHPKHLNFIKKLPFTPTPTTYNTLMKACGSDYSRAKALMDEMKSVGLSPNHISWSILMDICGASGNIQNAVQILKNMREAGVEPDVVAYTTAIKICVECKNLKLAFSLFTEMKRYQIKPNLVTYNTLLRARSRYGSLQEVQQCLYIYQDMRKAGYKPNDYYLKQIIEEWCEGVLQDNNHSQDEFTSHEVTDSKRPNSVLLEKVAAHLHNSIADTLMIDLQGLTKVEARIVILAVLRMIKENFALGHLVKDDMWITLGVEKHQAKLELEVKDAVVGLLQNELGLEVQSLAPRVEVNTQADPDLAERLERNSKRVSSTRRPVAIERLKITRKSLDDWLQRREGAKR